MVSRTRRINALIAGYDVRERDRMIVCGLGNSITTSSTFLGRDEAVRNATNGIEFLQLQGADGD